MAGEIGFADVAGAARRRPVLVIGAMLLAAAIAFALSAVSPPVYQSSVTIMLEPGAGDAITLFPLAASSLHRTEINTAVEILGSDSLLAQVWRTMAERRGERRTEGDLSARDIASLRRRIKVSPIPETELVRIRTRAPSPGEATDLANAMAAAYVRFSRTQARGEIAEVKAFLFGQLELVRTRLERSEENLRRYQEEAGVADLPEETRMQVEQIVGFESALQQARTDLAVAETTLRFLESEQARSRSSLVGDMARIETPLVAELRSQAASLEALRTRLIAEGYSEQHEKLRALEAAAAEIRGRLISETQRIVEDNVPLGDPIQISGDLLARVVEARGGVESLRSRVSGLEKIVSDASKKLETLPARSLELARLTRAAESDQRILELLATQYEQSRIREAGQLGSVSLIDRARPDDEPVLPRTKVNVVLAAALGLLIGLAGALLAERSDGRLASVVEIESICSAPRVGTVPLARNGGMRLAPRPHGAGVLPQLGPEAEAFRELRTNLKFLRPDDPIRTVLVTSPGPGDGKSAIAANLAAVLAQAGIRTLLIDADLRKPTIHESFSLPNDRGLTEFLRGAVASADTAFAAMPNLHVLPAGPLPPNPSELVASRRMRDVLQAMAQRFDMIVIDSPPVVPVTDAALLATITDVTLLVVRCGLTSRGGLGRALRALANVHVQPGGLVINAAPRRRDRYGYGYYQKSLPHAQEVGPASGDEDPRRRAAGGEG